jgi:hypothetical protein
LKKNAEGAARAFKAGIFPEHLAGLMVTVPTIFFSDEALDGMPMGFLLFNLPT